MLPNIAAMPTTWLALARLGAVMVPMNIAYTRARGAVRRRGRARWTWLFIARGLPGRRSTRLRCTAGKLADGADRRRRASRAPGQRDWGGAARRRGRRAASRRGARARRPAEHPVHVRHDRLPEGLHADAALLADDRQGQRAPRRPRYRRILAATPFFYMDPQWLLLMAFYQRAHAVRGAAAERQPLHGLGARPPHPVLPVPRSWSSSSRRRRTTATTRSSASTSTACARRSTPRSRSASTSSRARPSA